MRAGLPPAGRTRLPLQLLELRSRPIARGTGRPRRNGSRPRSARVRLPSEPGTVAEAEGMPHRVCEGQRRAVKAKEAYRHRRVRLLRNNLFELGGAWPPVPYRRVGHVGPRWGARQSRWGAWRPRWGAQRHLTARARHSQTCAATALEEI
eukprot:scaffold128007_cov75-Phaeocystis_antarctica.AAC.1